MTEAIMKTDSVDRYRSAEITILPTLPEKQFSANGLKRFMTIEETSAQIGMSVYYLRVGCRSGKIPCVKSGNKYMVNIPKLIQMLDAESEEQHKAE